MITAVVDANVLASGFVRLNSRATPVQLVNSWNRRRFELVVSDHIVAEVIRTLRDPYFRRRISPTQSSRAAALLHFQATRSPITVEVRGIATHPEDDLVLATALSAKVDYLVTGDEKLQKLKKYEQVTIVSPREFLELLTLQE